MRCFLACAIQQGKDKKTRKFAAVKRMISPKDMRINSVRKNAAVANEKKKKEEAPKQIDQIPSNLFFKYNAELGPPYNVLVDTNFINFSIKNKLEVVSAMMDCLLAKCVPCITDCVMAELERLGHKYRVALRLAKDPRFERLPCTHKGTYADDCLLQRVQQHRCYLVATCDRELKRRIRKVPGVPIMYISNRKYVIERLPEANAARVKYHIAFLPTFGSMKSSVQGQETSSKALSQYATQREELLDGYFQDTKLLQVLQAFLTKLVSDFKTKRVLPANPYPRLLQSIRQNEIERSLVLNGASNATLSGAQPEFLLHEQQQQQQKSGVSSAASKQLRLCTTKELLPRSLWGVLSVLERLDLAQLGHRVDAIREMHPSWFAARDGDPSEQDDEGYSVTVFGALVGCGNGFALAEFPIAEVERHVVVADELLEKAMAVFARQLFKHVHELLSVVTKSSMSAGSSELSGSRVVVKQASDTIECSGICITTMSGAEDGDGNLSGSDDRQQQQQVWTTERVNGNRNAFVSAVKIAIVSNASFAITSFSGRVGAPNDSSEGDPRVTICQTRQRFFFHFASENTKTGAGVKTVKAPLAQQQNRSFLIGTRVLESGVFLSAHAALEIATRVQNATPLTASAAAIDTRTSNNGESATDKAQAGKKSSEIRPSEPNSTHHQLHSHNLCHTTSVSLTESVCANPDRVWRAHDWLQSRQIFRQQGFQPSKGSYCVQTFHSLFVFHPLMEYSTRTNQPSATGRNASSPVFTPLLQELEVLEHVVVEGGEFAQALAFFAEAATLDLRRLAGLYPPHQTLLVNPMEATIYIAITTNASNDANKQQRRELGLNATRRGAEAPTDVAPRSLRALLVPAGLLRKLLPSQPWVRET